jgi:5-methylcytosine-specific restriction endonuclease McrA
MKKTKEEIREYQRKWQKDHREIVNKSSRDWQQSEKGKAYSKILAATPNRRATRKKYSQSQKGKETLKRYKISHPEYVISQKTLSKNYYKTHKEKCAENRRGYLTKNPGLNSHYVSLYRIRKLGANGSYTLGEWELLKKQYGYICPCCGKGEPEIKLTADHIVPLSKGGSNYIENIQPLCKPCNSRKHTQMVVYENKVRSLQLKKDV